MEHGHEKGLFLSPFFLRLMKRKNILWPSQGGVTWGFCFCVWACNYDEMGRDRGGMVGWWADENGEGKGGNERGCGVDICIA